MRTVWTVVVVVSVLAPFFVALTTKGTMGEVLFFLVAPIALTALAWFFGIPPLLFWSVPVAGALPWAALLGLILLWAQFIVPQSERGGAAMTGLFPIFGMAGSVLVGILVSFFLGTEVSLRHRVLWPMGVSTALVVLLVVTLGLIVINPLASRGGADGAPSGDVTPQTAGGSWSEAGGQQSESHAQSPQSEKERDGQPGLS